MKRFTNYGLRITIYISLVFFPGLIYSQQKNIPLNREWGLNLEAQLDLAKKDSAVSLLAFKPLIENKSANWNQYRSVNSSSYKAPQPHSPHYSKKKFFKKLKQEDLVFIHDTLNNRYRFGINPLMNFELGKIPGDTSSSFPYKNTRGVQLWGDIGSDFSFESTFYENQAVFPDYVQEFADSLKVIPGQGRWKKFKKNGYDYAMAMGYISYSPSPYFNFQLGHGKHFTGEGYRSLLLSDNSFSYPFFRITSQYKNFRYTNLFATFMNYSTGGAKTPPNTEPLFQKKAASFQFLEFSFLKRINIGLFQGMIWEASDTSNRQHLNLHYFNPLIFVNTAQFGLGSTPNILLGSTLKVRVLKNLYLYTQYALDEFADGFKKGSRSNKQAFQAGVKYLEAFTVKGLFIQAEFNRARPYLYSHKKPEHSYSHYNQSLTHPLGANFTETVAILNYQNKWFFTELKWIVSVTGRDSTNAFYGNNILNSDNFAYYGVNSTINEMGQGIATTIKNLGFTLGYMINPAYNLNIAAGVVQRDFSNAYIEKKTRMIFVSLRTSLTNAYYDF